MNRDTMCALVQNRTPVIQQKEATVEPPALDLMTSKIEGKEKKRCGACNKKLSPSDFQCGKCVTRFCGAHRLPETHACTHDFKAEGQALLSKQNKRIVADKIEDRI